MQADTYLKNLVFGIIENQIYNYRYIDINTHRKQC